jgi:hypothetical protein
VRFTRVLVASALLTASVTAGAAVALPGATARADTAAGLPITRLDQMVVDSVHGYLFFSQGTTTADSILVTDLNGDEVTTIGGQDGVEGLALSPDGSTLYAALGSDDAVSAISTTSLKQTALHPLPAGDSPSSLAVQSDNLWVGYNAAAGPPAGIGAIDLGASSPSFMPQALPGSWPSAPYLAADPSDGGTLVAGFGNQAESYDVASKPATVLAQPPITADADCGFANMTVVPGGAQLLAECGTDAFTLFSTADLSTVSGSYATGPFAISAAVAPDGMVAVDDSSGAQSGVSVYRQGASSPLRAYDFGNETTVLSGGLGWSADGTRLFVVTRDDVSGTPSLEVLYPQLTSSSLDVQSLTANTNVVGGTNNIHGTLSIGGNPAAAGTQIDITRTQEGTGATAQFTTTTGSSGDFSSSDTLPALGTYAYDISYPGNATTAPATFGDYVVTVSLADLQMTLGWPEMAVAGQSYTITGSVRNAQLPSASLAGLKLDVTRTVAGRAATFTTTANANGDFTFTDAPLTVGDHDYTFSYPGSSAIAPVSQKVTVPVSASKSALTLARVPSAALGHAVALAGNLSLSGASLTGVPAAPGTQVTLTRTVAGGTSTAKFTATTDAKGDFTLTDTPKASGAYTYTASYTGNAAITPARASTSVAIQKPASLSMTTSAGTVGYGSTVKVTIHLGTTQSLRSVTLLAQTVGSRATRTLKTANVNSQGNLTLNVPLANSTTFTAKFAGDRLDLAAATTRTVSVAVKIAASLSGYYTSARLNGVAYRVYHHTATLKVPATVTPDKQGECVELQVQRYYSRSWHAVTTTGCGHLSSKSQDTLSVKLSATGEYRGRVYYIHSASDSANISTYGGWLYYEVVR